MRHTYLSSIILLLASAGLSACGSSSDTRSIRAGHTGVELPAGHRVVVFVANAEGGTVSLIDAQSLQLIGDINVLPDGPNASLPEDDPVQAVVGQQIVEAAGGENYAQDQDVSPDGRTLYVSRGHRGDVAAFDIASGQMLWKATIAGLRADHMTISADGQRLYVSALTEDIVQVLDSANGTVLDSFATGNWPHDNHFSPDGQRLYNASIGNIVTPIEERDNRPDALKPVLGVPYQITVVDAQTLEQQAAYEFEAGVRPFVITADESTLYLQFSLFHGLIEFDLQQGEISRRLDLPVDEGVSEDDYSFEAPHHGLALSADEKTLCVAGRASDYAALVDVGRFETRAIIDVGDAPSWALTGPLGRYCFLANTRDGTVSVVDYALAEEVARIGVGQGPKHLTAAFVPEAALCLDADHAGDCL